MYLKKENELLSILIACSDDDDCGVDGILPGLWTEGSWARWTDTEPNQWLLLYEDGILITESYSSP